MAGDKFEVESAGLEPGRLNPVVVEVMKEVEIFISQQNRLLRTIKYRFFRL